MSSSQSNTENSIIKKVTIPRVNESFGVTLQNDNSNNLYECIIGMVKNGTEESMKDTIHQGDRIMSVNGTDVQGWSFERVVGAVRDTPNGEPLVLDVSRTLPIGHPNEKDTCFANETVSVSVSSGNGSSVYQGSTRSILRHRSTANTTPSQADEETPDASADKQEDLDEEADKYKLEEDIFSLLFMAETKSPAFVFSLFSFLFQLAIIILIVYDLLSDAPEGNPLKIPPGVSEAVVAAQFLALIVAITTQDDVITTLEMVHHGYCKDNTVRYPHATYAKYCFANSARFIEGFLTILVSFLFIVTSTTALDIFKDFAAMVFVSELDNFAFQLANKGFVMESIQTETKKVQDAEFKESKVIPNQRCKCIRENTIFHRIRLRNALFALTAVALFTPWIVIRARQSLGFYKSLSCESFTAQFGDETFVLQDGRTLHYAYFSNTYKAEKKSSGRFEVEGDRPVFYERGQKEQEGERAPGKFSYCKNAKAWVFTIEGITHENNGSNECDENWLLRSPETEVYAVEEVPMSGWMIWTGTIHAAKDFSLSCDECKSDVDCNFHGSCVEGGCECNKDWTGERCNVGGNFCDELVFVNYGSSCDDYYTLPGYTLLQDEFENAAIKVYDRPVYHSYDSSEIVNVIIYTGRRWYDGFWEAKDISELRNLFSKESFHAHWDSVLDNNTNWFSEPTDSITPIGLEWHEISTTRSRGDYGPFGRTKKSLSSFHCKNVDCAKAKVCGEYGTCNDGVCNCDEDVGGYFCQFASDDSYIANNNWVCPDSFWTNILTSSPTPSPSVP